ncbi:MAG TPA: phytanoyl-CoA dioxygenase family protein [Planctomycetes bacterium]|nr:phytanoyl-CoA dioxygenase family protein [Planctomycetota bacterium]
MDSIEDLAIYHQPITDTFKQPDSHEQWLQLALSSEQVKTFEQQGFIAGIPVLDSDQVQCLRQQLDRLMNPNHPRNSLFYEYHVDESEDPDTVLFHALGGWRIEKGFHDLLFSPVIRMVSYQLLASAVRFFHDQLFCKPPQHGGVVSWHQDFSYWTWTQPMAHLTCWIALDDTTRDNGCLHYIPGSHRWGLLPVTGLSGEMDSVRENLDSSQRQDFDRQVAVELHAGEAVFHHPLTMHGSFQNISSSPRRGAVVNLVADGVWSNPEALQGPGTGNFPILPQGEFLGGEFYPLLFDPQRELSGEIGEIPLVGQ